MERVNQDREITSMPFVPAVKEKEYFELNKIEVRDLPNGIKIISMGRVLEDDFTVGVRADFNTGAYNDPPGKSGLHHLGEHLICDPALQEEGSKIDAQINGITSSTNYTFTLNGIANPSVRNFGVWPLLKGFRDSLVNPLGHFNDFEAAILKEKGIVLRELEERKSNQNVQSDEFKDKVIFARNNPVVTNAGGTPKGLSRISREDIKGLIEKVLIPDKTIISAFCQGPKGLNIIVADELAELFSSFPRSGKISHPVDRNLLDLLNPEFDSQGVYIRKGISKRPMSSIWLVCLMQGEPYSESSLALEKLSSAISKKVHDYVRERGISYGGFFGFEQQGNNQLCYTNFPLQTTNRMVDDIKSDLIPNINGILEKTSESEFADIIESERLRQLAIPMSAVSRYDLMISGLLEYGKCIDADQIRQRYFEVSPQRLKSSRDKIVEAQPAIFVL